jgi:hypothetical protein
MKFFSDISLIYVRTTSFFTWLPGEAHRRLRSAGVDADNCRAATSSMSSSLVTLANPTVRTRVESIEAGSNKSRNGGGRVRKTGESVRKNSTIVVNSNCNGKRKAIDGEKSGAKKGRWRKWRKVVRLATEFVIFRKPLISQVSMQLLLSISYWKSF